MLGWGSLIWDKKRNEEKQFRIRNNWHQDGPSLPIEFARISKRSRLTLVLSPEAEKRVRVLWAYLKSESLKEAIQELSFREDCSNNKIGYFDRTSKRFRCNSAPKIRNEIEQWIKKTDLDAVVWTDLKSNFMDRSKYTSLSRTTIILYLQDLINNQHHENAEKYIRNTPNQIKTYFREIIERELDWMPI